MTSERGLIGATTMGLRTIAIIEAVLLLAAIVIFDLISGTGDRFFHVSPHPFWIVVLLVSVQYGALEGVLAAILASGALLIGNLPPLGFGEDPYAYSVNLAINPAMWMAAALGVGELRSQADRRAQALEASLAEAAEREERLIAVAERLTAANRSLEERVAGQLRTVATLYEASRAVEQLGTGDVLIGIAELVRAGINPKKFSLFLLNEQQLESVISEGWSTSDRFTRVFPAQSTLFREVIINHRSLCVASRTDQAALAGEGILAGPIFSAETGETLGMLKIEGIDAIEFNMTTVESFRVICQWIGTAFARARTFERASNRSLIGTGTILGPSSEYPLTQFMKALAERARFELGILSVSVRIPDTTSPELKSLVTRALRQALQGVIRQTDIACERNTRGLDYLVLAPCCPPAETRKLCDKLNSALAASIPEAANVRIAVTSTQHAETMPLGARA